MRKKRDFLKISDLSKDEIRYLIDRAKVLKNERREGKLSKNLSGKIFGMIFEKPSTRTRISFEVGIVEMGATALYFSKNDLQMGRGEDIKDTARVLSRYLDGIIMRAYSHKTLEDLARFSDVPVINALTDLYHPCQILSDLLTIEELFGTYENVTVAYIGDGNNVANSWVVAAAVLPINLNIASPSGYEPKIKEYANERIKFFTDPKDAIKSSDIVYTDVWFSMGQSFSEEKRKAFLPFRLTLELCKDKPVLHCLPAKKGEEITEELFEKNADLIFTQSENRLHFQKALLEFLIKGEHGKNK